VLLLELNSVIECPNCVLEKTVRSALGEHGASPKGKCEDSPDPSEVSSLGKLSVFLISYNLITRNDITTELEVLTIKCMTRSTWTNYVY